MKPYSLTHILLLLALAVTVLGWTARQASADPPKPRMASAHYALDWTATGEISGGEATSAHFALRESTTSQMAANTISTSANYALCTGWECLVPSSYLNLPLLMR